MDTSLEEMDVVVDVHEIGEYGYLICSLYFLSLDKILELYIYSLGGVFCVISNFW